MADKTTQEEILNIEVYFVDGDTRTIAIKNPKETSELTTSVFAELNAFIREKNALVGDRAGSPFGRIAKAERVNKTKVQFDLEAT